MAVVSYEAPRGKLTTGLGYYARVIRTVGAVEFKIKYAESVMGYVWSVAKPLAYFAVLMLVFQHLLGADQTHNYPIFLLVGILLYTLFASSVTEMLPSIVQKGTTLRRLSFAPVLIPLSMAVSVGITFGANLVAAVIFFGGYRIEPRWTWLLVPPLLVELYLLIVGLGLLLSALYVRFRDIGQVWELSAQILMFASGVMYPIGILPQYAQRLFFVNPLVQVMQDIRHQLIGPTGPQDLSAAQVFANAGGRLIPVAVAVAFFVVGLLVFRSESRYFAERI
jgi:ABC-2 type transport system permease protein